VAALRSWPAARVLLAAAPELLSAVLVVVAAQAAQLAL
jgi:hypothetical protein